MTWLKSCFAWIVGAFVALTFMYLIGRRDGKNAETEKQKDKTIRSASLAKRVDDLADDIVDSMPSKYD